MKKSELKATIKEVILEESIIHEKVDTALNDVTGYLTVATQTLNNAKDYPNQKKYAKIINSCLLSLYKVEK